MADDWMVETDSSDEEVCLSLGSEGMGGPPKRKRIHSEPEDVEMAELYRRIATDGYIQLQCIVKRREDLQLDRLVESKDIGTENEADVMEEEKETEEKRILETPVTHDSTFDFCDDVDVIPAAPLSEQKRVAVKGAKKRKPKSVGRWSNVIRHLQIDYETELKMQNDNRTTNGDGKEKDSLLIEDKPSVQVLGEQSEGVHDGLHMSFSLSSIDSSMTKDALQEKIKHAETLVASQQPKQAATTESA